MRSLVYAALVVSLCDCAAPVATAPLAAPTSLEADIEEDRQFDCLPVDVREELARGLMRAEDLVARCQIDRDSERKKHQIILDYKNQQLSEMQALRVQANLFKLTLAGAVVGGLVAAIATIFAIIK